jgi:hypothetical protein
LNEYLGWYEGRPEDADEIQWKLGFDKPLIVSEFGGSALYGYRGDAQTRWSEKYQANLFQHQLKMIQQMPSLVGLSPWVLMDFHSPRRTLPGIQDYHNRKGLVSDRGEHKQAFYVLQKYYRDVQKAEKVAEKPPAPAPAAAKPKTAKPAEAAPPAAAPAKKPSTTHGSHHRSATSKKKKPEPQP